ncbi:MAG: XRE family transcriptional regulator [Mesorhizobium sp.]|nr:helix-turn-helix domain-containing protein [Mesorhizobium sp. M4A.F.Ca.ET.090.04.2.1]AZO47524.1 XRE family transcriptional regulator [Mesorhizobium sp. M4B.F.Ca.ET.058.02.1.1]RWD01902.1 MAG: XRE family transcriptional regulator [Mesorhizobium sp.]TIU56308.1 MAG: helix-turn-helix domain-containing protein [Mesorhizobium sp.]TJW66213.1 MAG: helix-turn-helix domain-containing protein [Mesorhizobium sp.]
MPAPRFQQMIEQLHATGLTCRQIAEAAKLSHSTVHRLATGEARAPAYSTVRQIERLFAAKNFASKEGDR